MAAIPEVFLVRSADARYSAAALRYRKIPKISNNMDKLFITIHKIGAIACILIGIGLVITSFVGAIFFENKYDHCFYMGIVYGIVAWICASNAKEEASKNEEE